jgi:hypothetical protein
MKPHKPANDAKDNSDARNSPQAHVGHFRPLSPFQNEDLAADGFIPPHGGYENLLSFQKARIVYDGTVRFCECFLDKRDRTLRRLLRFNRLLARRRFRRLDRLDGLDAEMFLRSVQFELHLLAHVAVEQ